VEPVEEAPSGYQEEPYWYREGLNVHSRRWVTTLLFLGLHDVTGLDMVSLTRAPFGIAIFLFALLYLFVSAKDSLSPVSQWGFLLASLLYLLSYWSLGWIYHSGAWPALALLFIILGLVFRLVRRRGHAVWERAFLLLFLFLNFWIYHGTMMLMVVFLPFLLIYGSAIQLVQTTPGVYAPPRPYLYQTLAMVSLAVFFLDPLSTFVLSATGVLRPWEGPHIFVSSLTEQSGNYATYLVGYPPIVRAAMVAQMVCPFAVATWLWISDHLLPLLRRQRLSETDIVIGALYLSVPVIVLGTVVVGQLRTSEPNLLLILATSLLLVRHVFRGERVSRGAVVRGSLVATALLVIMAGASVMHIRDPMSRYADVHDSDAGVAEWAAEKIDVPYFADAFFTGLVLMDNAPLGMVARRDYVSVVSADNFGNGEIAAEILADHIPDGGTACIVGYSADFYVTNERDLGFRKLTFGNENVFVFFECPDALDAENVFVFGFVGE